MKKLSRRNLLLGTGAGLALSPFIPLLESHADVAGPPKRLVVIYTPTGMAMNHWRPSGGETDFVLGRTLEPLLPHRDRLIVMEGLYNAGARVSPAPAEGHQAVASLFSGQTWEANDPTVMGSYPWSTGATIDQVVADATGKPAMNLAVAVECGPGTDYCRHAFARGYRDMVQGDSRPASVYDRWFADFTLPADTLARLRAERRSTLDFLKGDIERIRRKISRADRDRVDAHLEGVLALEGKLGQTQIACTPPGAPEGLDPLATENLPWVTDRQIDLMVSALACDMTRVATLQWGVEATDVVPTWLGLTDQLHDMSHLMTDPSVRLQLSDFQQWLASKVAMLVERLENTLDADGTPLMESTLVVWGTCLAEGVTHSIYNVPHVALAGSKIGWKTGRYLKWGDYRDERPEWEETHPGSGQPNNRLLCSIGRAMGLEMESFGDTTNGGGALDALTT